MTAITISKADLTSAIADAIVLANKPAKATNYVCPTYASLVGQIVAFRTVTMVNVGRVAAVLPEAFLLEDAVWIANADVWSTFCAQGVASEVEPFGPGPVFVSKAAMIDLCILPKIPKRK